MPRGRISSTASAWRPRPAGPAAPGPRLRQCCARSPAATLDVVAAGLTGLRGRRRGGRGGRPAARVARHQRRRHRPPRRARRRAGRGDRRGHGRDRARRRRRRPLGARRRLGNAARRRRRRLLDRPRGPGRRAARPRRPRRLAPTCCATRRETRALRRGPDRRARVVRRAADPAGGDRRVRAATSRRRGARRRRRGRARSSASEARRASSRGTRGGGARASVAPRRSTGPSPTRAGCSPPAICCSSRCAAALGATSARRSATRSTARRGCSSGRRTSLDLIHETEPHDATWPPVHRRRRAPERAEIDRLPTAELVRLMNDDDATVPAAVAAAAPAIAAAVDAIVERLAAGGRLIYVGAGTAGRIGVLDASECGPTFNTDRVLGVIAGGPVAVSTASESAEDDPDAGAQAIAVLGVGARDAVVGISASGRTPYVLGAIERARGGRCADGRARRATPARELSAAVEHPIEVARRPGVHRRLDAPEGRHGAEARAQHALDADDGAARQDLREPDGRRARRPTRSCATGRRGSSSRSRASTATTRPRAALARGRRRRQGRGRDAAHRDDAPTRRASASTRPAGTCAERSSE